MRRFGLVGGTGLALLLLCRAPAAFAQLAATGNVYGTVTDESGAYTISGVPPGKHTLNLWHERLGEKEQQVEVPSAGAATANLQLTPK